MVSTTACRIMNWKEASRLLQVLHQLNGFTEVALIGLQILHGGHDFRIFAILHIMEGRNDCGFDGVLAERALHIFCGGED